MRWCSIKRNGNWESPGHSDIPMELIVASGEVWKGMIAGLCQTVLCGFGMPTDYALSVVGLFFIERGDII